MRSPASEASPGAGIEPAGIEVALTLARPLLGADSLLLACDFDGTLARLSPDPWAARILPGAQRALRRLAGEPRVHVALISGRTVADLAERTRLGGVSYRGDHGAERAEAPRGTRVSRLAVEHAPVSDAERDLVDRLALAVPRAVAADWLVIERKWAAVTFHFRGASDLAQAAAWVAHAVDAVDEHGTLARHPGRRALELRPRGAVTKAAALRSLVDAHRPAAVIMIGDDPHDAQAFDVVRVARAAGELEGLAVAVAGRADVTAQVAAHADLVLASPAAVARFLGHLASAVAGT